MQWPIQPIIQASRQKKSSLTSQKPWQQELAGSQSKASAGYFFINDFPQFTTSTTFLSTANVVAMEKRAFISLASALHGSLVLLALTLIQGMIATILIFSILQE